MLWAYVSALRSVEALCWVNDLRLLLADLETVAFFIEAMKEAGRKVSTIEPQLAAASCP